MGSFLRLEHVSKCFPTGQNCEISPLKDVSLEIGRGEKIVLLGKSGSGKSTFLNLVGGVDVPTSGRIFFDRREITNLSQSELSDYRRKEVGFIFQSFNLFPTLTVRENVMLPLDLLGRPDSRKAREILSAVGLNGHGDKFPEQLSGGEQQRVAIARALIKEPNLILADEPTGNLDQETGEVILSLIYEVSAKKNATLVLVTHSPDALWIADRTFTLKSGKLTEPEIS
ncbi:MAG: ABC transporter ATP-binding protein [Thermodesulfobacteriota bacterium]